MQIAVSSQNFRTISGHAGKARRFIVYAVDGAEISEIDRFDLPAHMAMHDFDHWRSHPLDQAQVLITASCGDGFAYRMARRGVRVVVTGESDPEVAVYAYLLGYLRPPLPHVHRQGDAVGDTCVSCG